MTADAGLAEMWRTQAQRNRVLSEHSPHPITRANLLRAAENYEAQARQADYQGEAARSAEREAACSSAKS